MSPEQKRGDPMDARSDVYALELLDRALLSDSANIADVLEKALAERAEGRFSTATDLEKALKNEEIPKKVPGTLEAVHEVGQAREIVAADIDGDGDIDIAAGSPLVLLVNDGIGTLTKYGQYAINGSYMKGVDLNSDDRLDLVGAHNGNLMWWPQVCLP